ncbi:MAG: DUF362 domain-containing protein [Lentisphaerae bacterium]|nr:DUF362 domain-containing protein [Lentisphaerota bacterium]
MSEDKHRDESAEQQRKAHAHRHNASAPRERGHEDWPNRREFIKRLGAAAALAGGTGYLWLAPETWPLSLRDPTGDRGRPQQAVFRLKNFRVDAAPGAKVLGVARGGNWEPMLRMAIAAIGGIGHFIRKGDVVLIKPNVAFDRSPKLGATTNPEVLAALIRLLWTAGAAEIRVTDNPIESPESCFVRSGITEAALRNGAKVVLPSPAGFEMLEVPGAQRIVRWPFFYRPFRGADKVIGVAPVKDHNLCHASLCTKNWYGLLGGRRNQFHQDIHTLVADLALMIRPTFVILDGSRILMKNGPTGGDLSDVVPGRTLVAATDQIAADAFGYSQLLGRTDELPQYLLNARARGLGESDWRAVAMKEEQVG